MVPTVHLIKIHRVLCLCNKMTCCIHVFTADTPLPEARTTEVPVVTEQLAALSTDADDVIIVVMPILVVITLCVASLWLLCWGLLLMQRLLVQACARHGAGQQNKRKTPGYPGSYEFYLISKPYHRLP